MNRNANRIGWLSFVVAAMVFTVTAQDITTEDDFRPKVDEYMKARLAARSVGGSVIIAKNGQISVYKGFGLADVAANTPIYGDTKFRIGSVTKTVHGRIYSASAGGWQT